MYWQSLGRDSIPNTQRTPLAVPIPTAANSALSVTRFDPHQRIYPATRGLDDEDEHVAKAYFSKAPYIRRITELQLEIQNLKREMDSLRFRCLPRVGNNFNGYDHVLSKSPWLTLSSTARLSSQLEESEARLKRVAEELEKSQEAEAILRSQLDAARKELDEKLTDQSNSLKHKETEISLLKERNQLLFLQLEEKATVQAQLESNARAAVEEERRELDRIKREQEKERNDLEYREQKVFAESDKLKRDKELVLEREMEAEDALTTLRTSRKDLERQRRSVEERELQSQEEEVRLKRWEEKLASRELELESQLSHRTRVEREEECNAERLKQMEVEAKNQLSKLKQQETELGRMTQHLNHREELVAQREKDFVIEKKNWETTRKKALENTLGSSPRGRDHLASESEGGATPDWKKRYEESEKIQQTLKEQLKQMQQMHLKLGPVHSQEKPKTGMQKHKDDVKALDALKDYMQSDEHRGKAVAPHAATRGRKVRDHSRDSRDGAASDIVPPVGPGRGEGSSRGKRRQATPDVHQEAASASSASAVDESPTKKRRQESINSRKGVLEKTVTSAQLLSSSSKKPPRPRTRSAVGSDAEPAS